MHHACILRSPHGAARIRSIAIKAASEHPGVAAVFTGKDVAAVGPVPCGASLPGCACPRTLFWPRTVSTLSDIRLPWSSPRTANIAADALDLIEVDYEPSRQFADPEKALAPGAPAVHPEWPDNIAFTYHQEGGDPKRHLKKRSSREAAHHQPASHPHCHGDARRGGGISRREKSLILHSSTQIPHLMRTLVAMMLDSRKTICA